MARIIAQIGQFAGAPDAFAAPPWLTFWAGLFFSADIAFHCKVVD
jgi:hypothetical protein